MVQRPMLTGNGDNPVGFRAYQVGMQTTLGGGVLAHRLPQRGKITRIKRITRQFGGTA